MSIHRAALLGILFAIFSSAAKVFAADACDNYSLDSLVECLEILPKPKQFGFLKEHGIQINGLLNQTMNTNSRNPTNFPNGVGNLPGGLFLYRNDEYMFNWLGVSVEKEIDTSQRDWDAGFEFDVVYGTDYFSLQSRGLEQEGDGSNRWNADNGAGVIGGLHGLALPQLYGEFAYQNVSVKIGKFFHPLGFSRYEPNLNSIANTRTYSAIYGSSPQ